MSANSKEYLSKHSRKEIAKALDSLPTDLAIVCDQLQLRSRLRAGSSSNPIDIFEDRIHSSKDELEEYKRSVWLVKYHVMEHLQSQQGRLEENVRMYSSAVHDFIQLSHGVGPTSEVEAFKLLFGSYCH